MTDPNGLTPEANAALLADLAAWTQEPLCDELAAYATDLPVLGPFVKHPLVFGPAFLPGQLNRQLQAKQRALDAALAAREFSRALWLYERPYRLPALAEWARTDRVTRDELRDLVLPAWMDTEFPHQFGPLPRMLFRAAGFVTDAPALWGALGDRLTVYRGDTARPTARRGAIAWTLARGCAEWFARRFAARDAIALATGQRGSTKRPQLWAGTIRKADALAYVEGRGEAEVVVSPARVRDLHPEPMGDVV